MYVIEIWAGGSIPAGRLVGPSESNGERKVRSTRGQPVERGGMNRISQAIERVSRDGGNSRFAVEITFCLFVCMFALVAD